MNIGIIYIYINIERNIKCTHASIHTGINISIPDFFYTTMLQIMTNFNIVFYGLQARAPTSMICLLLVSRRLVCLSVCLSENRAGQTSWTPIVSLWCRLCLSVCLTVDGGIFCQMLPPQQQQQQNSDKLSINLLPPKNIIHFYIHKLHKSRVQIAPSSNNWN